MRKCEYGCDKEAKFQLKNGKWCCESFYVKCSVVKLKISKGLSKAHKEGRMPKDPFGDKRAWSRGLTAETDERVKIRAEKDSKTKKLLYKQGKLTPQGCYLWTDEKRKAWSKSQSEHNIGGKCKWYEIDGKKVQGTWEFRLAKKLNEMGIQWIRPKSFIYCKEGKIKHYTPDFYLVKENLYLETKGFLLEEHIEKMRLAIDQNSMLRLSLRIIQKDSFYPCLDAETKGKFLEIINGPVTQLAEVIGREPIQ